MSSKKVLEMHLEGGALGRTIEDGQTGARVYEGAGSDEARAADDRRAVGDLENELPAMAREVQR